MTRKIALALMLAIALAGCAGPPSDHDGEPGGHDEHEAHEESHEGHGEQEAHGGPGDHPAGQIEMATQTQAEFGLKLAPVSMKSLDAVITATGEFVGDADRLAHIKPRVTGRVVQVLRTVGDRVAKGEALARLESPALGEAQASYLEALAQHALNRSTLERQRTLMRDDLIPRKLLLEAESQARLSEVAVARAKSQLRLYGLDEARITKLAATREIDPVVAIEAPIGGLVVERELTVGESAEPAAQTPAFVVQDTSALWVNATLYERDMAKVHEGQTAVVTTPAFPWKQYRGRVALLSASLDPDTRTGKARVVVENADGRLRPEMSAAIRLSVGKEPRLAVPDAAVMNDKEETFVFVQTGPETFEKRPVEVGEAIDGHRPVSAGLTADERVVVEGAFTLKSELLKESFGGHHH